MEKIGLPDMIRRLRDDLQQLQEEGKEKNLHFAVQEVELELQVTVSNEGKAGGGVKFWLYDANMEAKIGSQAMQKIKLKLKPQGEDETIPVLIADQRNLD